jgi:hypothetical protein
MGEIKMSELSMLEQVLDPYMVRRVDGAGQKVLSIREDLLKWAVQEIRKLRVDKDRISELEAELADWRKGVEFIAACLGEKSPLDLCCVRLGEKALEHRAQIEALEAELKLEDELHCQISRDNLLELTRVGQRCAELEAELAAVTKERDGYRKVLEDFRDRYMEMELAFEIARQALFPGQLISDSCTAEVQLRVANRKLDEWLKVGDAIEALAKHITPGDKCRDYAESLQLIRIAFDRVRSECEVLRKGPI